MFRQVARANLSQILGCQMVQLHCIALFVEQTLFGALEIKQKNQIIFPTKTGTQSLESMLAMFKKKVHQQISNKEFIAF